MGKQAISIIIPVYNQYESLQKVIKGFGSQNSGVEFEIIIIDDGSDDLLQHMDAADLKQSYPLQLIHQKNAGRAAARNKGVSYANGDLLIFCDADRVPASDFVAGHARMWERGCKVTVGAPYDYFGKAAVWEADPYQWDEIARWSRTQFYYQRMMKIFASDGTTKSELAYLSFLVGNASMDKAVFEEAGCFNEKFTAWGFEHYELAYRVQGLGYRFFANSEIKNYHIPHSRPEGFYEKHFKDSIKQIKQLHPEIDEKLLYAIFLERGQFV